MNILDINNYIFNQLKDKDKQEVVDMQSEFINIAKPLLINRNLNYGNFSKTEKNTVLRKLQKKLNIPERYIEESSFFGSGIQKDYQTNNNNLHYRLNISTQFTLTGGIKHNFQNEESVLLNFNKIMRLFDENNMDEALEIDFYKDSRLKNYCYYDKTLNVITTNRGFEKLAGNVLPLAFEHLKNMSVEEFTEMFAITKDIDLTASYYKGLLETIKLAINIDKPINKIGIKNDKFKTT